MSDCPPACLVNFNVTMNHVESLHFQSVGHKFVKIEVEDSLGGISSTQNEC